MFGSSIISITPKELAERRAQGETLILLDVREDFERTICTLENDYHIPMGQIQERLHELDANAPTVVYCQKGGRSKMVAGYLVEQGFKQVYNLKGGIHAWAEQVDPEMPQY